MRDALIGQLSGYDRVVEVGVGREPSVMATLAARGVDAVTVDVHDFPIPDGVSFVRDDVFTRAGAADPSPYATAKVVYALSVPVELHRPAAEVAHHTGTDFLFTTLDYDEPPVPVFHEPLPGGTLYVAKRGRQSQRVRRDSPGRSQE